MPANFFAALASTESSMQNNNVIIVMKCAQEDLFQGSVQFKGYEKSIRLTKWPGILLVNPFSPKRSDARILSNPQMLPITIQFPIGGAVPMAFQLLCNGNNLKSITITELISTGENLQKLREIVLSDPYVTNWRVIGVQDGLLCEVTFEYNKLAQSRTSVGQDQQGSGVTAATSNLKNQQPEE